MPYVKSQGTTEDSITIAGTYSTGYSVILKNVSGNLVARNVTDTADAPLRVRARPPAGAAAAGTAPVKLPEAASASAGTLAMHSTDKTLICGTGAQSYRAVVFTGTSLSASVLYQDSMGRAVCKATFAVPSATAIRIGSPTVSTFSWGTNTSYPSSSIGAVNVNNGDNVIGFGNGVNVADSIIIGANNNTLQFSSGNLWVANGRTNTNQVGSTVIVGSNPTSSANSLNAIGMGVTFSGSLLRGVQLGYGASHTGDGVTIGSEATGVANTIVIGDSVNYTSLYSIGAFNGTVGATRKQAYVDSAGYWGYNSSSLRYKENIRDYTSASAFELEPVVFDYKDASLGLNQIGFIAESVYALTPEAVCLDSDDSPKTVNYADLVPALVAAIRHMKTILKDLQDRLLVLET
jgi:hypothetical protein